MDGCTLRNHSAVCNRAAFTARPSPAVTMERRCLVYHMHRFIDFRVQELQSVSRIFGCQPEELRVEKPFAGKEASPAWYASFPNDETARMVAERAMLVKGIFELWGEGSTWEEVEAWYWKNLPDERRERWTAETVSFKFTVDAFGRKCSYDESLELIHKVTSFVKFKGKVQMKDADAKFWIIVTDVSKNPGLPQDIPYRIYFGRELGLSRRGELITQYSLTKRRYLGPTSMHHELAFIMCNMALVDRSKLVFDPFVGTGSILVAAAHHRACTMGADIDVRVIREGKLDKGGEPVTVWTNFQDYGLPEPVGLVRFDLHTAPWRYGLQEVFDAIVCDPPYGVRAGGRKLEPKDVEISESQRFLKETARRRERLVLRGLRRSDHIAKTEPYTMGECLRDTLECAGKLLRVGGRLVFFMPSTPETADDPVPQHPMLSLVADSEQPLSSRYSRRLITMEKSQAYDSRTVEAFYEEHPHHEMAIDTIHDWVYDPQHPMQDRPNAKKRYRGKVH